ncbi:DoxX family protein [Phycicoccus sp. CSK15P-2]|nr:DoxX family protein [Phycicoccus sp. CSK15P-2]
MTRLPSSVRDVVLLVARLVLGVVFVVHGWQKVVQNGLGATGDAFAGMGVPAPEVSAVVAGVVELVGGAALLAGVATAVAGVALFLVMLGAALFVHVSNGVLVDGGGWELVGALGVGALALAAVGPGRYAVDGIAGSRRRPS